LSGVSYVDGQGRKVVMANFGRQRAENGEASSASKDEKRKQAIREALAKTEGQDDTSRAAEIEAMLAEPTQKTTDWMWRLLVAGLLGLMLLALAGVITMLLLDKNTQVLSTIFAALLGGLLGLFVPSPGQESS
jgi:ATP:corrinoid adenosyltransferase